MRTALKTFQRMLIFASLIALASVSCKRQEKAPSLANNAPHDSQAGPDTAPSATPKRIFKSGVVVPSGYLGYKVHSSWFATKTNGPSIKESSPNLYVDLSVVNTDKKDRPVPPLTLVDETGAEHEPSKAAWKTRGSLGLVSTLAPATSARGFVRFEVSKDHTYKLKLKGFKSVDDTFIELAPEAKPQSLQQP